MPTLHLGVADQPYGNARDSKTTGDVARILEDKYRVMGFFYQKAHSDISEALENSVLGAVSALVSGAPSTYDPFGEATSQIEHRFRKFLSEREMDYVVAGVPTQASLVGYSKRFKQKQRKARGPRPSFVDTGLYQSSFRAWVD